MSKQPERRRRVVRAFAPAVGLLAAGLLVWQGSYAAFNATTNNSGSTWGTATLKLTNNGGLAGAASYQPTTTNAVFGGTNLKPGATGTQCLTVDSTGSTSGGNLAMWVSSVSDTTGVSKALLHQLTISVSAIKTTTDVLQDCAAWPTGTATTLLTNVALDAASPTLPTNFAAATPFAINSGDKVAYKLVWNFNSTGSTSTDNLLQGKSASATFNWELQ